MFIYFLFENYLRFSSKMAQVNADNDGKHFFESVLKFLKIKCLMQKFQLIFAFCTIFLTPKFKTQIYCGVNKNECDFIEFTTIM